MLNRIVLIGRLVADPQLRYTHSGVAVANMRIAVDRPFTNQQGERETDFIDIVCWRKLGETVANHLTKGRLIAVDGRLQIRQYEWEGQKRQAAEVYADDVRFLDSKRDAGGAPPAGAPGDFPEPGIDEVPF
ncbi:MAG: single-stranded DNA-binding protein [Limnochordia bacterium]|jgi:single-strand DNA-binding protein